MSSYDVAIIGAGHNGLVAAILLALRGLSVIVLEERAVVGGAARTEYPFAKAPGLGASTGAYLLGLMPPELLRLLDVDLPLKRRDPHYFLPTTGERYLLLGSDKAEAKRQFLAFFGEQDFRANEALNEEIGKLREDVAPAFLLPPLSIEETAERFIRRELRQTFISLCRGTIRTYLDRFGFESDLVKAMYAATDAFTGVTGGFDTEGTGMNFLLHNMCRLPGADGTWMIVEGGMGTVGKRLSERARALGVEIRLGSEVRSIELTAGVASGVALASGETISARAVVSNADPYRTRDLVGRDAIGPLSRRLDELRRDGSTFKVNLCLDALPTFTCLPDDRGQFGPTIHILPDEPDVMRLLDDAQRDASEGRLPEFPAIEWYFHTPIDPTLRDAAGHHNAALFVQWVPRRLADGSRWDEERYARHLLSLCDRFAPGTSDRVVDMFPLSPLGIEEHFGIRYGHIQHIDHTFGFADRVPHRFGVSGLYACGAGTHPGGGVIGAGGYNAAREVISDLGLSRE